MFQHRVPPAKRVSYKPLGVQCQHFIPWSTLVSDWALNFTVLTGIQLNLSTTTSPATTIAIVTTTAATTTATIPSSTSLQYEFTDEEISGARLEKLLDRGTNVFRDEFHKTFSRDPSELYKELQKENQKINW